MAALGNQNMKILTPQPSQILTVFTKSGSPLDITLDGGATGSFIKHECAVKHNFKIWPNNQSAGLADNKTNVKSIGYIEEVFFRDKWSVKFKGLVVENLKADVYGGQPFMIDNDIIQRPARNIITVLGKYTVMQTNTVLPTKNPNSAAMITFAKMNILNNVIYPGQSIIIDFKNNLPTAPVSVEVRSKFNNAVLPTIQSNPNCISVTNSSAEPLIIPDDINVADIVTCSGVDIQDIQTKPHTKKSLVKNDNYKQVNLKIEKTNVNNQHIKRLTDIHEQYQNVFDGHLTGYNGRYGKHSVSLQWADETRPKTTRIHPPTWSSSKDIALQRKIDQLTDMGVLADPYEHNVQVKCIHPCFLQKKARAAGKNFDDCSIDELRFLTAPNAVNEKCRQIQTTVPDQNQIFRFLGNNKCVIFADLYESFFQNHLDKSDWGYIAINSPFKGLRVYTRSTQGLLNQDEELNQLLSKVIGDEIMKGICMKIADDLIVGGDTIDEAIDHWETVLQKLSLANLKLSPGKVRIFPKEASIFGWTIKNGTIIPDPHRQLALSKTKHTDIHTVSDLRSWIGVYKTFLIAMPGLALTMDPFDKLVAGVKDGKTTIQWTPELVQQFSEANDRCKNAIQYLTLPRRDEQLILMPDATLRNPAVGITLNVIREQKLLPVIFYSFKLTDTQTNWWPCEREALAVATAIKKCSHFILESTKPLLILSDSKPVVEAFQLMRKGKFSTSSRMAAFLYAANQYKVDIQHISGKYKQNVAPDYLSRNPATCNNNQCQICKFITETSMCVVSAIKVIPSIPIAVRDITGPIQTNKFERHGPLMLRTFTQNEILSSPTNDNPPIGNKQTWTELQQQDFACSEAHRRLVSGQQPNKRGPMSNDIRKYYNSCQAKDLLVVVEGIPNTTQTRNRIVVPKDFVPAIASQLHHRTSNHPSQYQLEKLFNKYYFGIHSKQAIAEITNECVLCKSNKYIAPFKTEYQAISRPDHPGRIFNIDVMRRNNQKVMVCRDLFSTYTTTAIVRSEQAECLLKGILECITVIRAPGHVKIRTDGATGFQALRENPKLEKLNIVVETTDPGNKNSIATADNAIKELESELVKLSPHDPAVNPSLLALATKSMNNKIRNRGLTAFEIMFSRDSTNQKNLNLTDKNLLEKQMEIKQTNNNNLVNSRFKNNPMQPENFHKGDTVVMVNDNDKTKARDIFMVTDVNKNKIQINKIIRYHSPNPKIQNKPRIVPLPAIYKISGNKISKQTHRYTTHEVLKQTYNPEWTPYKTITDSDDDIDAENIHPQNEPGVNNNDDNQDDDDDQDDNDNQDDNDDQDNAGSNNDDGDDPPNEPQQQSPVRNPENDPYALLEEWENKQREHAARSVHKTNISQETRALIMDLDSSFHEMCTPPTTTESELDMEWDNFSTPNISPVHPAPLMQVQSVDDAIQHAVNKMNAVVTNRPQRLENVLPIPTLHMLKKPKKKRISPPRDDLPLERYETRAYQMKISAKKGTLKK